MTPLATYYEESPGLRRDFVLHPDRVTIAGRGGGNDYIHHVPLGQLCPEIGTFRYRHGNFRATAVIAGWAFAILILEIGVAVYSPSGAAWLDVLAVLITGTGIATLVTVAWMLRYRRRYMAYRFVNTGGLIVLDLIEAGPEPERCREFAERVSEAVRQAQGLPATFTDSSQSFR